MTMYIIAGAVLLLLIFAMAGLGIWVYRDAKSRGLDAAVWTLLAVLIPNFIGVLLYFMIGRKQEKVICPSCQKRTEKGKPHCFNCGGLLPSEQSDLKPISKKPLMIAIVCVVLAFAVVIGTVVLNPFEGIGASSGQYIAMGMTQSTLPGKWRMSFHYFDGDKTRSVSIDKDRPLALHIVADISEGTMELGVSAEGMQEERISLHDLDAPYTLDLSEYSISGKLTLRLYAEEAKGSFEITW